MARPREFDPDQAIEGAMEIFWENGYGATNLPDLLDAMGLTRGSFYKAFGDKRSVYIEALKRYDQIYIGSTVALLTTPSEEDGYSRLLKLFEEGINDRASRENRRGCLVCNAMVELGPTDAAVAQLTAKMCARMQEAIYIALTDGRETRATSEDLLKQQSIILTNLYFGAQAINKSGNPSPDWKELLRTITAKPV